MKAVLLSIWPQYCELIASGKKTVEVRKTRPKLETPFKCYIYCTMDNAAYNPKNYLWKEDKTGHLREIYWNGKVIGEFVCRKIDKIRRTGFTQNDMRLCIVDENLHCHELDYEYVNNKCCISIRGMEEYAKGGRLYGWHISDLVIYDKPKGLNEFYKKCETLPCEGCEHLKWMRANAGEYEYDCDCMERLPITRPPQSWCYVEEV